MQDNETLSVVVMLLKSIKHVNNRQSSSMGKKEEAKRQPIWINVFSNNHNNNISHCRTYSAVLWWAMIIIKKGSGGDDGDDMVDVKKWLH